MIGTLIGTSLGRYKTKFGFDPSARLLLLIKRAEYGKIIMICYSLGFDDLAGRAMNLHDLYPPNLFHSPLFIYASSHKYLYYCSTLIVLAGSVSFWIKC